ncbi:MAG: hypothetical protein IJU95_05875 [Treponema sp.]|nr:hypothetical protein [Treponema sp.]
MNKWRRVAVFFALLTAMLPLAFAQSKAEDSAASKQDFTSYRGQRKPVESGDLYMESFVSEYRGGSLTIDIGFNQGIDPRSIKGENIQVNGKTVKGPLKVSFNKEGTVVRLVIGGHVSIPYSFSIWGIRSYSGREMEEDHIEDIGRKDAFTYQDGDGWQRRENLPNR